LPRVRLHTRNFRRPSQATLSLSTYLAASLRMPSPRRPPSSDAACSATLYATEPSPADWDCQPLRPLPEQPARLEKIPRECHPGRHGHPSRQKQTKQRRELVFPWKRLNLRSRGEKMRTPTSPRKPIDSIRLLRWLRRQPHKGIQTKWGPTSSRWLCMCMQRHRPLARGPRCNATVSYAVNSAIQRRGNEVGGLRHRRAIHGKQKPTYRSGWSSSEEKTRKKKKTEEVFQQIPRSAT